MCKNPLRYRGYYYDAETGMYYLQSRCYNPEIGRFISRDDAQYHEGDTGVKANLYAYCDNNPVMNSDPSGHKPHLGKHWWNKDWFVATAIDVLIICIPALATISAAMRAKQIASTAARVASTMSRKALRNAFVKLTVKLSCKLRIPLAATIAGALVNAILTAMGTSLGRIIANLLDWIDGRKDGYLYA